MRKNIWTTTVVISLVLAGVGCDGAQSNADTLDGGWATSEGLANNFDATGGVSVGMSVSLCAFNPATTNVTLAGNHTSTLSCYLGTPAGGATPVALRVAGVEDGTDYTLPLTGVVTPGWGSHLLSWNPKNVRAGTNTYSVWYTLSNGSESNRATVNLTFGSATATGTVEIATAVIAPNPASVNLSSHLQYYDTDFTFNLYLTSVDPDSPVVEALIAQAAPRRDYRVAITAAPTSAAWLTVPITAPLPDAGDYSYDVTLYTADGKASNTITTSVPVIDSSQNPYGGTVVIATPYFETNPVLIDFAGGNTTGTSAQKIFVKNLPNGKIVKSVWLQNEATSVKGQAAVTAQPAFPGWMTVTWSFYAAAAGNASYLCWLEMEDGEISNVERVTISFVQS